MVNALDREGPIDDLDRMQLHRVLNSLAERHSEGLSVLENTMMEQERKTARVPPVVPVTAVPPPPPPAKPVDVFIQKPNTESFIDKLKRVFRIKR